MPAGLFPKIMNGFKRLILPQKGSILNVWKGPTYALGLYNDDDFHWIFDPLTAGVH